jgi:maleate isomerase
LPERLEVEPLVRGLAPTSFAPVDGVARVGLILLSTDATSEADFARLVDGDRVRLHGNRIAFENPTTPESLAATGPRLAAAAADLLPGSHFSSIYFACTSATAVLGSAGVAAAIHGTKPGVAVVTPVSAVSAALEALRARRISILAPYSSSVTSRVIAPFAGAGLLIDRVTCWGLEDDRDMARVLPEVIVEEAARAMDPASDALFISCTALRAAEAAARIEALIARPVVTSNQAAAWVCRGLAGLDQPRPAAGRLFAQPFAAA